MSQLPPPSADNLLSDSELIEYTISVGIPDEMRTRDGATPSIGESGLLELENRTIDKLWYSVYYDGNSVDGGTVTRTDENPFKVVYRSTGRLDPTKLYFFLWAGNSDDQINVVTSGGSGIIINNKEKSVTIWQPSVLNDIENLKFYDSFAGYVQFSEVPEISSRKKSIVLKRPFAEIQVLSDDFTDTDLSVDYPEGFTCLTSISSERVLDRNNTTNYDDEAGLLGFPNKWYFSEGTFTNAPGNKCFVYFYNDLKGQSPYRTTFKERSMDYYSYFLTFPSNNRQKYLNLLVKEGKSSPGLNDKKVSISLPEEGIKANNKYIFYNKKRSEGGTGFLEGIYNYEIIASPDPVWDDPTSENESDRLSK